jgi:hypothetical protein
MKLPFPSLALNVLAASAALTVASSLHAAPVTQAINDQAWDVASTWSNNALPTPGNDYSTVIANPILRSTFNGTTDFAGNSLTIVASTELITKGNNNADFVVPNLILNGGQVRMADGNRTHILSGGLNVAANSALVNPGGRTFQIDSILSGSVNLTLTGNNATDAVIVLNGAGSTFSGSFLGTNQAIVDFNQSYNSASLNLLTTANQAQLRLDTNLTFQSVTFGATTLSPGVYTGATLKSTFASFVTADSLNGSTLTVVPEPSTIVLLIGAGLVGLVFLRRRVARA